MPLNNSPLVQYELLISQSKFVQDDIQLEAITCLNEIHEKIENNRASENIGLYLWGDVGRGKTFLMDLFYSSIATDKKLRLHFHHFMERIHKELNLISGKKDPLHQIAKKIAKECRVLCFDEFFVSDIGDAMLLSNLFASLFKFKVILIATSNIAIKDLYRNGLQRELFLPCIDLLQQYTQEFHLSGPDDHRLRHLNFKQIIFNAETFDLNDIFMQYDCKGKFCNSDEMVLNRPITVIKKTKSIVWFSFQNLCLGPRSQLDYIEIAKKFKVVLISHVPRLGGEQKNWIKARGTEDGIEATVTGERIVSYASQDDAARRFISLVDELYDRRVKLYLTSAVALAELYAGGALEFEFKRTFSRLTEMQSTEYFELCK